jgi:hypothetical protein
MEMSQEERAITEALDRTARREKLFRDARGSWRLSWSDLGSSVPAGVFIVLYFTSRDGLYLAAFAGALLVWHVNRIEARLNAIVHLLDREA